MSLSLRSSERIRVIFRYVIFFFFANKNVVYDTSKNRLFASYLDSWTVDGHGINLGDTADRGASCSQPCWTIESW